MAAMARFGAVFPADADVTTLPGFARVVEQLGYDELWVIEDCFLAGGLALAATALAVTERIRVGIGLMPIPMRNPALAAMEIATLANLHPGRFIPAFGHGVTAWMQQIGAAPPRRLRALREVTSAVRALLAGETVTMHGDHVDLSEVTLDRPPAEPPPVLIGSTGERGLALAGSVADGFLLAEGCAPAFVTRACEWSAAAAPDGVRPHAAVYCWLRIDEDGERARAALRPAVDGWLRYGLYSAPYEASGIETPLAPGAVPADVAERIAIAGAPGSAAASAGRLVSAGADSLIVSAVGEAPQEQYERFAREVRPSL
jgi:alkanesulfonate monooxygenase SsuD/methylene tetrahydromethanopterin reductase-like flavin-dependent oxidoreductase (luciferase family)